ncbi:MAG: hypothetical protein ACXWJM_15820 [Ramlibacter sp.]
MHTPSADAPSGRTLLIQLAEGKTSADFVGVAHALGMTLAAFDSLAQRAYPLSPGETAAQYLLRNIGRSLAARTRVAGLEVALTGLMAAASDPRSGALLDFLADT